MSLAPDDVARLIIDESRSRGHTREETIAELADAIQESGLRGDAVSPNKKWRGVYQQDESYPGRDDPVLNVKAFFDLLDKKRTDPGHGDIWANIFWLQQRPSEKTAADAFRNGRQDYMTEIKRREGEATALYNRLTAVAPPPVAPTGEHVIAYDRGIVPQDTGYWCGPASAQTVLNGCGIHVNEDVLAREIGTHQGGTDYVGLIEKKCLDIRLPGGNYTSVYLEQDPPSREQKDKLWGDLKRSIDAGFGVVMNWVAPPGNYPRGVKGSPNPSYGGGTVYHYVAAMGYDDAGARAVWIADSGFRPYGYWVSFDQCATLIPPKGYAFADVAPVAPAPPPPAPTPPPVEVPKPVGNLRDPVTREILTTSKHRRKLPTPRWIGVHTQEDDSSVENLALYLKNPANKVSYHVVCDDREVIRCVQDVDSAWAAANANDYSLNICLAGSYAGWSRDKWLETNASDGKNEDLELTKAAEMVAWWCQEYKIPAVWIGGRAQPPWGLDGICGHGDFGKWGGGHTDPGPNFPVDEFMRRVTGLLTGVEQPPLVGLPPAPVPGTDPSRYKDVLIYRGRPDNNREQVLLVQRRLKAAYASYGGHLQLDGDYSWSDEMVVREFQRRSRLVVDGIVGPNTAAALKPW